MRIAPSQSGFQVELPLWRFPNVRSILVSSWDRTWSYVQRAGLIIVLVSIGFWFFMNLPSPEHSVATMVGHWIQPILTPMGVDWRVGVALFAAFAAREVFVSALAVVYSVQGVSESNTGLLGAMRNASFDGTNQAVFTTSSTIGLIVFFIIALQCMTTVAVMRREVSNRFAFGQMVSFILLAWVLSIITVQGLRLLGAS
jgi:ferrous iron transport protein B